MTNHSLYLANAEATEKFGIVVARSTSMNQGHGSLTEETSPPATVGGKIHLRGELGAGKTTLTRGIMRGYGYQGAVKSPTYTLVEPYELAACNIYHFDLYRLVNPREVEFLGTAEYFEPGNLCIIEWPEHGKSVIPGPDLDIELQTEGDGRRLNWRAGSPHGEMLAERLLNYCRNL
jgi:tRNA threonylcarbamoyladenosine biosynthesis protein TsaE